MGCARLCKIQKRVHSTASESDKVYQLLAHGRWFSQASSAPKTGHHEIAEILLKVALNTKNQIKLNQSHNNYCCQLILGEYVHNELQGCDVWSYSIELLWFKVGFTCLAIIIKNLESCYIIKNLESCYIRENETLQFVYCNWELSHKTRITNHSINN